MSKPPQRLQQFFKETEGDLNKALEKAQTTISCGHSFKQKETASNSRQEINTDKALFDQVRFWGLIALYELDRSTQIYNWLCEVFVVPTPFFCLHANQ